MHQISSTPFDFRSPCRATYPGTCFCDHVGVNAPTIPKIAIFLPFVASPTLTGAGPEAPSSISVPSGSRSPTLIAIVSSSSFDGHGPSSPISMRDRVPPERVHDSLLTLQLQVLVGRRVRMARDQRET